MTEHYKTFGLDINIDDSKLLNDDLKGRLKGQTWEQVEAKAVGYIGPNACVLELGACIGIVACLINNKISDKTKQVSIETNPDLIEQLTRVRDENNCKFEIVNSFLDTSIVNKKFSIHPTHAMGGRLGEVAGWKQVEKQSVTIESLEEKYGLKFDTLVMDIEGGEFSLWREGFFTDRYIANINLMMIEFHADQQCSKMKEELRNNFEEIVISSSGGCHSVIVYKRK